MNLISAPIFTVLILIPPFDDARVRRAFCLSIDRERLVEKVLKGGQTPATTFTPPGTGGFYPTPGFRHDPDTAKSLLNSYLQEKGLEKLPPVELSYNTSEGHKKVAEALHAMWKDILGVEIRLLNMEWKVFFVYHLQWGFYPSKSWMDRRLC